MKRRILIPIASDLMVRNFIDSGALKSLEKNSEIHFLLSSSVKKEVRGNVRKVANDFTQKRTLIRYKVGYLSMKRFESRSPTFPIKRRETFYSHLSFFKKIIFQILSLPGIYEFTKKAVEVYLGRLPEIDQAIEEVKPTFMLIPSGFSDSYSIDSLKSAKAAGIPHLLLMFNWDNVSCKGVLPIIPEHLGVWGEQTRGQAERIHLIPRDKILILGSPQFETYRDPPTRSLEERKTELGFDPKKTLILYLGISRYRDESALLSLLENDLDSGSLKGAQLVYRPHPWREIAPGEKNFFDLGFKHIVMDPQLETHYKKTFSDPKYDRKSFVPDYSYAPKLFQASDAVISSLTTMGVEAMLMGKPVLLPVFPDPKFPFSTDTLVQYEHHDCWARSTRAVLSKKREGFASDCAKLLVLARDPRTPEVARREIEYVVKMDPLPYCERLKGAVEKILETP